MSNVDERPVIVHIIFRLSFGGLENGLVNLINHLSGYRHIVVCCTDYDDFRNRITAPGVDVYSLHKRSGKDWGFYYRLWRLLRRLRPKVVHTRNLSTIEGLVMAALAGVPYRIHSEHGRDIFDIHGKNKKYLILRRFCGQFAHRVVALSKDLESWLINDVRIPVKKLMQLYNGVDLSRFSNIAANVNELSLPVDINGKFVVATVGRLEGIKDQQFLLDSFIYLLEQRPSLKETVSLLLVGDGSMRKQLQDTIDKHDLQQCACITGKRDDVAQIMKSVSLFVLPSKGEGISNTILEAMASGLPVVATRVGGNPELVEHGQTGFLVEHGDIKSLSDSMLRYVEDRQLLMQHGDAGKRRVHEYFDLKVMVSRYDELYTQAFASLSGRGY